MHKISPSVFHFKFWSYRLLNARRSLVHFRHSAWKSNFVLRLVSLFFCLFVCLFVCFLDILFLHKNVIWLNPFLLVHIPYVQSEGILPQIRLLQWRAYIFWNTQCFSTKLGRNMVNALFCHKTLKYWWPLTYIQGHVIQDGCQIQSEKSILSQQIAITRPFFWQIW